MTGLLAGASTVRFELDGYRRYSRGGIELEDGLKVRLITWLLPESCTEPTEVIAVCDGLDPGRPPPACGCSHDLRRVPLFAP